MTYEELIRAFAERYDAVSALAEDDSTDTYAVAAVYSVFGCDVVGEPISCSVENLPQGTMLIVQ